MLDEKSPRAIYTFDNIQGTSPELCEVIDQAKFFASSYENVLITGESGVGKELFAQAIHNISAPDRPFVALNCAALPGSLIESELFGYEPGSFTGADKRGMPGKIELADNGTLFLDEIGDMPYGTQAILLRVLQEKQVSRIGSKYVRKVDFRVIAATNQNINKLCVEKQFRSDLYFRLAVLKLHIPPLRERISDLDIYLHVFMESYCQKLGCPVPDIEPEVLDRLYRNEWPGNVREVANVVSYLLCMSRGGTITMQHIPRDIKVATAGFHQGRDFYTEPDDLEPAAQKPEPAADIGTELRHEDILPLAEVENAHILRALAATNDNVTDAAQLLKISKTTLYRRLSDFGYDLKRSK